MAKRFRDKTLAAPSTMLSQFQQMVLSEAFLRVVLQHVNKLMPATRLFSAPNTPAPPIDIDTVSDIVEEASNVDPLRLRLRSVEQVIQFVVQSINSKYVQKLRHASRLSTSLPGQLRQAAPPRSLPRLAQAPPERQDLQGQSNAARSRVLHRQADANAKLVKTTNSLKKTTTNTTRKSKYANYA